MAVKNWLAAVAMSACVFGASTASAALLNGGFEEPVQADGTWNVYNNITGWTAFDGDAGIEIQTGNVGGASAIEGVNKVELDSHGQTNTNSGMSQSLSLTAGSYKVSFQYLGRTNDSGTNGIHYGAALTSGLGATVEKEDFNPGGIAFGDITGVIGDGWTLVSFIFSIGADADVSLGFWAGGSDDTLGGYIDDVQISAVPLPPAMLLFGGAMLGLGWLSRRRKAAA